MSGFEVLEKLSSDPQVSRIPVVVASNLGQESDIQKAKKLGVREFVPRRGPEIRDDHLPLHDIAGIPACDVIDFEFPFWHTEGDTPDKCSALSLAKVGWVIEEWLKTAVRGKARPQ